MKGWRQRQDYTAGMGPKAVVEVSLGNVENRNSHILQFTCNHFTMGSLLNSSRMNIPFGNVTLSSHIDQWTLHLSHQVKWLTESSQFSNNLRC